MNTKNIYIILLVITCSIIKLNAQTVDQNVTVEREYKPVIQDAGKITSNPEILEITVDKKQAIYSEFNLPLPVEQNLSTLAAAQLLREKRENLGSFVRLAVGNYWNTMADLALPIIKSNDTRLDFRMTHFGTFADSIAFSTTKADLLFDHDFEKATLYAGMGAGHEYQTYYGKIFNRTGIETVDLTTLSSVMGTANYLEKNLVRVNRTPQLFTLNDIASLPSSDYSWRFNTFVGLKSLPEAEGLRYNGQLRYDLFDSNNGLTENQMRTTVFFDNQNEKNRVGINVELANLMYSSDNASVWNFWDSYSVFSVNPYYNIERESWKVRLGVKSSFSFVHGRPFNPSPDIYAEINAIPKWLAFYAGIGGSYDINSLNSIYAENRYLYSDLRVKDTYTPVNMYFGAKMKPFHNLFLDAYVNYCYINNQYFFVNKEYAYDSSSSTSLANSADSVIFTNRFNVIYSQATLLKIGARLNYDIRNVVNIELTGAYNGWNVSTEDYAWNKPKFELALNTDVKINRNFSVSANLFHESERFAKLGDKAIRMNPIFDFNVGVAYSYTRQFTVFAKINNLFNDRYEYYYGYKVQGMNALVGASFSFK
jgi:hypothetical protein